MGGALRVDGSESAGIYGIDDGVLLISNAQLALVREFPTGPWSLNLGWVEGVLISGSGRAYDELPPLGAMHVRVEVDYEYAAFENGSKYKTGKWRIQSASIVLTSQGEPDPGDDIETPGDEDPPSYYSAVTHRQIHTFDGAGNPTSNFGPPPIQVGSNLSI